MKRFQCLGFAGLAALCAWGAVTAGEGDDGPIDRGRYLVAVSGCNDCHTPGYAERAGDLPESAWLTGSPIGFHGPWGTTYPANLRLLAADLSESQWLARARAATRPPMPWFALRAMTDADLEAIYAFLRELGEAGDPAPSYVPPGQTVLTPYIDFMPKGPGDSRQAGR